MKKSILAASVGTVALAGLAWAAAGGMGFGNFGGNGGGAVLLPASSQGDAAPVVRATAAAPADGVQLAADGKHIVDAYICKFNAGSVGRGNERAEANRAASAAGGRIGHVYDVALQGFSIHASARGVEMMARNNPRIDYCEQDQVMAIVDPVEALAGKPGGGGTTLPAQVTTLAGVDRVFGRVAGATGTACVIDTGIDLDHPDLNVDVARSRNFVSNESSPNDLNGHGSHVAGTIAGIDNGIGTYGVAPGAKLVAIRVLNRRGSGSNSDVIAGVNYAATTAAGCTVANMSLGGGVSTLLDSAVLNASLTGVKFALAAGNETDDANNHSPARVNGQNVYTIAAFSATTGNWASFSNYGSPVDYAEPGVSVFSTWKDAGYNTISGTSMATPHFAGLLLIGSIRSPDSVTRTGASDSYPIGIH